MATVCKCDRCGNVYEPRPVERSNNFCGDVRTYNPSTGKYTGVDLCDHCREMLEAFLHWEPMACEVGPKPTVEDALKEVAENSHALDIEMEKELDAWLIELAKEAKRCGFRARKDYIDLGAFVCGGKRCKPSGSKKGE